LTFILNNLLFLTERDPTFMSDDYKYWEIDCPYCGECLKLPVTKQNTGEFVVLVCPKCESHLPTIIGMTQSTLSPSKEDQVLPTIPEDIQADIKTFSELIENNTELMGIIGSLRDRGCETSIIMSFQTKPQKLSSTVGPNGEIRDGVFNLNDVDILKRLKIKI
jgi:hypothetical protein